MKNEPTKAGSSSKSLLSEHLLADIKQLILEAREAVAVTVNSTLTMLYWQISNRIQQEVLKDERADYGQQILATLSQESTREFGKGFTERGLFHVIRFAQVFPDEQIVSALWRQLSRSQFKAIVYIDDSMKRGFACKGKEIFIRRFRRWTQILKTEINYLEATGAELGLPLKSNLQM